MPSPAQISASQASLLAANGPAVVRCEVVFILIQDNLTTTLEELVLRSQEDSHHSGHDRGAGGPQEDTAQDKLPTDQSIADTTEDRPSLYPRPPFNIPLAEVQAAAPCSTSMTKFSTSMEVSLELSILFLGFHYYVICTISICLIK